MSVTPLVLCLSLAIRLVTLKPGSWPPSPGFAPCAILISISLQLLRYSAVTPNLPLATCLTAELINLSWFEILYLFFGSPPSPVLLLAPAIAKPFASSKCAFSDIAPNDTPPEPNLFRIDESFSTSLNFNGSLLLEYFRKSLM